MYVVDNLPLLLAKISPEGDLPQCLVNLLFPVVHAREIVARHHSKLQLIDTWLHEHSTLFAHCASRQKRGINSGRALFGTTLCKPRSKMAGSALKRLMAEYKRMCVIHKVLNWCTLVCFSVISELTQNPPEGIVAGPKSEENFFEWEALITYVYSQSHLGSLGMRLMYNR